MIFSFMVPGEPVGKGRPRFSRKNGRVYTPDRTAAYEKLVRKEFIDQCDMPDEPLTGPVSIYVQAEFAIPKRATKAQREAMLNDMVPPLKKPDVDNVLKIITDPLNGVLWKDDSQIVDAHVCKFYSDAAHVSVRICVDEGPRFEVGEDN